MNASIKLKNGNTLEIHQDSHGESPREWDNMSTFICFHRRYTLGDTHNIDQDAYNSWQELEDENFSDNDIVVNLYMYDHGNISISTSPFMCRWDSGQVGIAVVTKQKIISEYGTYDDKTKAMARRCLEAEVETYNDYVQGEVYGYSLKDSEGEEIDSCFGFYGDDFATNGLYDQAGITEREVA